MAEIELRLQGARQIQLGMVDGGRQILAKRQMRCDGGRQRASGAMRIRIIDAMTREPGHPTVRLDQHVTGILCAMAALDEYRTAEMIR